MKIHGANSEYCLSYSLYLLSFTGMWTSDKVASHFVFTQSFIYSLFAALSSLPDNFHYLAEPSRQPFSLFPLHFCMILSVCTITEPLRLIWRNYKY